MPSVESYLCAGEKVVYSLSKRTLRGREELAATDRRIIHVRSGHCRDIGYGFLMSVQSAWSLDWKWGKRALYAALASLVFAGIGLLLPMLIVQGANNLSDYSNSLTGQMASAIIPPAYQDSGGVDFSQMPGMRIDFSSPAGSIGSSISSAFTGMTILAIALSVLSLLAFVVQIKRVLILTTLVDKDVFYYDSGRENDIVELIKILRAGSGRKNTQFRKT